MKDVHYILQLTALSGPMFSAWVCSALCFMHYYQTRHTHQGKLSRLLGYTFIFGALCWYGAVLYISNYKLFIYFNPFFFLILMLDQVLLYKFVYTITNTKQRRKFKRIHYIIPLAITLFIGVWSVTIPFEMKYQLVASRGIIHPEYPVFSLFFSSSTFVFCIYNILYSILAFRRANEYRREVINYSADTEKTSVRWIYSLIALIIIIIPIPLATIFYPRNIVFGSPLIILGTLPALVQHGLLTYNLISGNYVIIEPSTGEESKPIITAKLDRKKFEKYIREKKPYLDPKLKITDMCLDFGTNRSYLSAFINQEYRMNFSRYINYLRLEELQLLRVDPTHKNDNTIDLILHAGFSSYRSYIRVKQTEDTSITMLRA